MAEAPPFPHVVECETANDFLRTLGPANSLWGVGPNRWIFRGQSDADWQLVPSVLRAPKGGEPVWQVRRKSIAPQRGHLDHLEPTTQGERFTTEWELVNEFLVAADLAGLHIPEDTQLRRNRPLTHLATMAHGPGKGGWPPATWLSAVALAQHYGVPTRFLDWSWRSHVAAYFAAKEVALGRVKSSRLAVWAVQPELFLRGTSLVQHHQRPILVTAPYHGNPNLAAQSGVFTVDYDAKGPERPFETFVEAHALQLLGERSEWPAIAPRQELSFPFFAKVTLASAAAPELLRRLAEQHISAASLFPGYAGVVEGLSERAHWDRRPWE